VLAWNHGTAFADCSSMGLGKVIYSSLVLICLLWVSEFSAATISSTAKVLPKSFAVYTASFNDEGFEARGGVNGTIFFVSPTQAITAYHVLHASNFHPLPGFKHVRIWLVHEGYRPIEVKPEYLKTDSNKDMTVVTIPPALAVDTKFVYSMGSMQSSEATAGLKAESDGFIANSTGPRLMRQGSLIEIIAVEHLARIHLEGTTLRQALVNLKAGDIELKVAPELELSYQPIVGISGGPVVIDGKVVAMNSFADPSTRKSTWALQVKPMQSLLALR
jgi:hypothetical protein